MDNSAQAQRDIILGYLLSGKGLTTRFARSHLDIMCPATRIKELRLQGYNIITYRRTIDGHKNVAEYILLSTPK